MQNVVIRMMTVKMAMVEPRKENAKFLSSCSFADSLKDCALTSVTDLDGQFRQFGLQNRFILVTRFLFFDRGVLSWTAGSFPRLLFARHVVPSVIHRMAVVTDSAFFDISWTRQKADPNSKIKSTLDV